MSKIASISRWSLTPERRTVVFAFGALILLLLVGGLLRPGLTSPQSLSTILLLASFTGYVATGQMFVVLTGGIDLSVPWTLNSAAIILVIVSFGQNDRAWVGVLAALAVATLVGLANGVGVAYFGISAVVMTLAMSGIAQGLTLGLTGGLTCRRCTLGAPDSLGQLVLDQTLGIPRGVFLWIGISLVVGLVLSFTAFGRRVYATGTNSMASHLSGVPVKRVTAGLYALSGFFAGLAGVTLAAYGGNPTLGLGDPYLLQSIAVVVIGGVSVLGGRGLFAGVFLGAIILITLLATLQAFNLPQFWREIIYGVVLIGILMAYGRERRAR